MIWSSEAELNAAGRVITSSRQCVAGRDSRKLQYI